MQAGDLLFYRSRGRWYERVIAKLTRGPYVHVAVAVDGQHIIAAEAWGVRYELVSPADESGVVSHALTPANPQAAQNALDWLHAQLKRPYSWLDILDNGLRLLHLPIYLGVSHSFDCSDLAACFAALYTNDRALMSQVLDHRQEISPNDLARFYHLPLE